MVREYPGEGDTLRGRYIGEEDTLREGDILGRKIPWGRTFPLEGDVLKVDTMPTGRRYHWKEDALVRNITRE